MPCSTCGHPLLVNHKQQDLRCPQCLNLSLADRKNLVNKVERDRQRLHDDRVKTLLYEYSKDHLLLYLIERLNVVSHHFYENRRLNQKEFAYLNHLIKLIYPEDRSNFEDKYLERGDELDETIDALIDAQAEVINALNHIEDRFRLCVKYEVPMPDQKYLFSDYNIYDSEYRYCYQRCLRSLISGRPEDVELFDKTDETLRDFDILEADEIETLEDYAYTFFEFIISLLFVASANEVVGDIYTTFPPDYVTIFDIQDLLDEIDSQFTDEEGNVILQDSTLGWTNREGLNAA